MLGVAAAAGAAAAAVAGSSSAQPLTFKAVLLSAMSQQRRSVLADLGEELTGIVAPVSLCMALTVGLVRTLNPEGVGDPNAVFLASA